MKKHYCDICTFEMPKAKPEFRETVTLEDGRELTVGLIVYDKDRGKSFMSFWPYYSGDVCKSCLKRLFEKAMAERIGEVPIPSDQ